MRRAGGGLEMAIDFYSSDGSPWCWRVQLALEYKRLPYALHVVNVATQEHQSPHMLKLTPRGRLPVLKDGDYVVFESIAILYFLDRKYPSFPLFGTTAEEGGVILRVILEFQEYIEPHLVAITRALAAGPLGERRDEITEHAIRAASEARTIEGRLSKSDWVVGERPSAADFLIYPWIEFLQHALLAPGAEELRTRFVPVEVQYPALARWFARIEALPGCARTRPAKLGGPRADR
jgi:glutathione S-transferase